MSSVIADSTVGSAHEPGTRLGDHDSPASPSRPTCVADSGLTPAHLAEFVLKSVYLHGGQTGSEIARELRLPFPVIEESLQSLEERRCVETARGDRPGRAAQRFVLSELGRVRARDILEECRYVGPAPVSLSAYFAQCRKQAPHRCEFDDVQLQDAFRHLVIPQELLDELGAALCSGDSVFLHGPPGNGKTAIARALGALMNRHGGEIYVPYAVLLDGSIMTVFDPGIHQTTDDSLVTAANSVTEEEDPSWESESDVDLRWRRIRRPVVVVGGELKLPMLELKQQAAGGVYIAPPHVKANGGMFLVDDFGRQPVDPRELLNRWALPLEQRLDYLTLASGARIAVPFLPLMVFSTNLNPRDLVDDAFLRRVRHKISIPEPSREAYEKIFHNCCLERDFQYDRRHVDELFETHYNRYRLPRASDPQDLLEHVASICRFRNEHPRLDAELLRTASQWFFRDI